MSPTRNYIVYLQDMYDSVLKGISFIKGFSFRTFDKDEKTQYAVIRAIEIIGEASKKIPPQFKKKYPDIPWREISGMRDKLIHDYFGVNTKVVWKTAKEDLPALKKSLRIILNQIDK
ncbi:DUF86 domain-containing protein [Bacteroidota bacterium]